MDKKTLTAEKTLMRQLIDVHETMFQWSQTTDFGDNINNHIAAIGLHCVPIIREIMTNIFSNSVDYENETREIETGSPE